MGNDPFEDDFDIDAWCKAKLEEDGLLQDYSDKSKIVPRTDDSHIVDAKANEQLNNAILSVLNKDKEVSTETKTSNETQKADSNTLGHASFSAYVKTEPEEPTVTIPVDGFVISNNTKEVPQAGIEASVSPSKLKWIVRALRRAREWASYSKDPSTQVGAVVTEPNLKDEILAGYNGFSDQSEDRADMYANRQHKYDNVIHAELNLVCSSSRRGIPIRGAVAFIYALPPCTECLKHLIQCGVTRIYYTVAPGKEERSYENVTSEKMIMMLQDNQDVEMFRVPFEYLDDEKIWKP